MTYEELKAVFDVRVRQLKPLKKYDIVEINRQMSKVMGEIVSENVFEIEDVAEACKKIIREYFDYANEVNARLQRKYDEKSGLNIAPQKAEFPTERVSQIANSLVDKTVPPETIQRRAKSAVENVANSFHDDFIRKNAEFRSKAGVKCYIVRETGGKCCAWCASLAGRYVYGDEPDDIFRRHDNCICTVTFISGRERQDVWSKKKWQVSPVLKVPYKPTAFDRDKAKNTQKEKLAKYQWLDKSAKSGIIKSGGKITDSNFTKAPEFEEQAKKFYNAMISNGDIDVKAISENTGFSYDDVMAIKNHIMIEEHLFRDGTIRKFDPDIDQALAWQRMMNGNPKDTDILLLNHELRELKYIRETNCDYETAHAFSTEKYDWQTAKEKFVDKDNIDKKFLK